MREGEDIYKERYAGKTLTESQWIEAMVRELHERLSLRDESNLAARRASPGAD